MRDAPLGRKASALAATNALFYSHFFSSLTARRRQRYCLPATYLFFLQLQHKLTSLATTPPAAQRHLCLAVASLQATKSILLCLLTTN